MDASGGVDALQDATDRQGRNRRFTWGQGAVFENIAQGLALERLKDQGGGARALDQIQRAGNARRNKKGKDVALAAQRIQPIAAQRLTDQGFQGDGRSVSRPKSRETTCRAYHKKRLCGCISGNFDYGR
jgi:hypothetical protein